MNYYKLGINPGSKKWKNYMNPSSFLLDEKGNELSDVKLSAIQHIFNGTLYFNILKEGEAPPVISIGSRFLAFNESVFCADELDFTGVQLIPLINKNNDFKYMLMHVFNYIDCVDWESSKIDRWPEDYIPEAWESKRGRFFIEPVLYKKKIPENLGAFRLYEWGGAFNIVIAETFKEKLLSMKFDNTLLDFKLLSLK
ncbi:hypothetical protein ACF5F1_004689 [Salmonella enterica]